MLVRWICLLFCLWGGGTAGVLVVLLSWVLFANLWCVSIVGCLLSVLAGLRCSCGWVLCVCC